MITNNIIQQQLDDGNRNYQINVDITLSDNTVLSTITKENLFDFSIESAVSEDNNFTALGSVIIDQCKFTLNNIAGDYSSYEFKGATVTVQIGLDDEYIDKGIFIVSSAEIKGVGIQITCLDYMSKFDKSYTESQITTFPTTIQQLVNDACTVCGVTLTGTIPYATDSVAMVPTNTASFRQLLSYIGQITGTFVHVNRFGQLQFSWFDKSSLNSAISSSSEVSGVHYIDDVVSITPDLEDITITGIRSYLYATVDNESVLQEYLYGTEDFCLEIFDNPLVNSANIQTILNRIGPSIVGLTYRKLTVNHLSNPLIEAGDVAIATGKEDTRYPIVVSRTVFTVGKHQETICGSETASENMANRKEVSSTITQQDIDTAIQNYDATLDQEEVYNRLTNNSQNEGIYLEDGHLYVNASFINSGIISANRIAANSISVSKLTGTITNDNWEIDFENGTLTIGNISANNIHGGTLTLGGANDINGTLIVKDANNNTVVQMNNSGATIKGSVTTNNGNIALSGSYITFSYDNNQYGGIRAKWSINGQTAYYDLLGWTFSASRPYLQIGSNARGVTIGDPSTTLIDLVASDVTADYFTAETLVATNRIRLYCSDPWYYAKTPSVDASVGQTVPASGNQYSFGSYIMTDKNDYDVGWIEVTKNSDDTLRYRVGFRRTVSGSIIDHNISLYIEKTGTRTVVVSDQAAWRTGLGVPPTSHASSASTYGLGTTANYGHVKTINSLSQSSHSDGTALSAYQGYVLNWHMANGDFTVRFKTGTVSLADGTSGAKTATINLTSTDVPSGYSVWYVLVSLGNYPLPYHTSTNTARATYVSDIRAASITITNTAGAWNNFTYYLTIILKKN